MPALDERKLRSILSTFEANCVILASRFGQSEQGLRYIADAVRGQAVDAGGRPRKVSPADVQLAIVRAREKIAEHHERVAVLEKTCQAHGQYTDRGRGCPFCSAGAPQGGGERPRPAAGSNGNGGPPPSPAWAPQRGERGVDDPDPDVDRLRRGAPRLRTRDPHAEKVAKASGAAARPGALRRMPAHRPFDDGHVPEHLRPEAVEAAIAAAPFRERALTRQRFVHAYLHECGHGSSKRVAVALGIHSAVAGETCRAMAEAGKLRKTGRNVYDWPNARGRAAVEWESAVPPGGELPSAREPGTEPASHERTDSPVAQGGLSDAISPAPIDSDAGAGQQAGRSASSAKSPAPASAPEAVKGDEGAGPDPDQLRTALAEFARMQAAAYQWLADALSQ